MSEINGPKFSVNQVNLGGIQKTPSEHIPTVENTEEEPKFKDFGDPQAEALGRSMLVKDADNINHDLKILLDNPQVAENSDEMFETAYNAAVDAGVKNPYEEASTFATGNV